MFKKMRESGSFPEFTEDLAGVNENFETVARVLGVPLLLINRGKVPNDATGDTLREAAGKINHNFELIARALEAAGG